MSLSELCVRRPVFATMLVTSLVVLGIFSFRDLGVDLFPKADPATVSVTARLPGGSPEEMVDRRRAAARGGAQQHRRRAGNVGASRSPRARPRSRCRFVLERDIDDAAQDVREKVARAQRNLPPQVEPPIVQKVDPDTDPVITLVASGKDMSLRALTEVADKQIKRALESVDGVGEVSLAGGRAREIHIVVDVEKLNAYGISVD